MEAYLYQKQSDQKVQCQLCSHRCAISADQRGICKVRENRSGTLYSRVYGQLIAGNIDPIEKKPLFHFMPGSLSYSIATVGCNFKCRFCQNADIAQMPADHGGHIAGRLCRPQAVVDEAVRGGCQSISYTYTEPTIYFEFAYDTARLAQRRGLRNVFVTNGYMTPEALHMIHPYLDAANVDLKAYNEKYYRELCGARLEPVKATLKLMKSLNIMVEVTTLLVPGLNDDAQELEMLARFLAADLGPDTPWHISRFHPTYRLTDRPPTPVSSLIRAREIGLAAGLRYVYIGNVPGQDGEKTFCYQCGRLVIDRIGFSIRSNQVQDGRCPQCSAPIFGVGL